MSDRRGVRTTSSKYIVRNGAGRNGTHRHAEAFKRSRATQLIPRVDLITWIMALDAEFQIMYDEETKTHVSVIGRISIVDYDGKVIYDVFVYFPEEDGKRVKLPPAKKGLGVYWKDIRPGNGAIPIAEALETISEIIDGRVIVGHAIRSDIAALRASGCGDMLENAWSFRDTQGHAGYYQVLGTNQPGLKKLYKTVFGKEIQGKEHSSVEDAQATMELYRLREAAIELEQAGWDSWLDPRSDEEVMDEMINGPDWSYGPPPPKPLPRAFKVKKEQEELDAVAKQYRGVQAQKPLSRAAMAWNSFKKETASTPIAAEVKVSTIAKNPLPPAAAPRLLLTTRKDSSISSTDIHSNSETSIGHSKNSSISIVSSPASTSATALSATSQRSAAAMQPPTVSLDKTTQSDEEAASTRLMAAKRNAAIKIAYPLRPTRM